MINCRNINNCFACVGLRKKRFCIFNVQYSEEEYWQRVDELKCVMLERGEYGEYFSAAFSEKARYFRFAWDSPANAAFRLSSVLDPLSCMVVLLCVGMEAPRRRAAPSH